MRCVGRKEKGNGEVSLERNWEKKLGKMTGEGRWARRAGEGAGMSFEDEGGTYEQGLRLRPSG